MQKRGTFTIDDDAKLGGIQNLADKLRTQGLKVASVSPVAGQIIGTAEESAFPQLQEEAKAFGARFIPDDEEMEHVLPPPESTIQQIFPPM